MYTSRQKLFLLALVCTGAVIGIGSFIVQSPPVPAPGSASLAPVCTTENTTLTLLSLHATAIVYCAPQGRLMLFDPRPCGARGWQVNSADDALECVVRDAKP